MADVEACADALTGLVSRLSDVDPELRRKHGGTRTLSCTVSDLGVVFHATVVDGEVCELTQEAREGAQIKLSTNSEDLLALVAGDLTIPVAWASGRLRIEANVLDLIKLRSLL